MQEGDKEMSFVLGFLVGAAFITLIVDVVGILNDVECKKEIKAD